MKTLSLLASVAPLFLAADQGGDFGGLPGETTVGTAPAKETKAAKASGKSGKKEAAKPAAKGNGKAAAEKPAAKGSKKAEKPADKAPAAKASKKTEKAAEAPAGRKPRVEGRVDLVYRSGPERAIALKVAETHKAGEPIKVDNCTVGYNVKGEKGETLHSAYVALRDEWRKEQDKLAEKFLAKAASK